MNTTLGIEIFRSRNIADIRQQLERKAITCIILGQRNEHFPAPIALKNQLLTHAYHVAAIVTKPSSLTSMQGQLGDIFRNCAMDGMPAILSESPPPEWGRHDAELLGHIAKIEDLEQLARKEGRLL